MRRALRLITLVCFIAIHACGGAKASGRVFGREMQPICRQIASLHGVYAVWVDPKSTAVSVSFQVVLAPGEKAADLAPQVRETLSTKTPAPHLKTVKVEFWTYHDPSEGPDFRQIISSPFSDPPSYLGFPDYRGLEVLVIEEQFDPLHAGVPGLWSVTKPTPHPVR